MTVSIFREGWLALFTQMRSPTNFLSRMFTVKPGGIYNGDKINIDIERVGEKIAIAITRCSGSNINDISIFTTKQFTPPSFGESFPVNACDLINRMAGVDPYTAAYQDFAIALQAMLAKGFKIVDDMIQRSIELQASQILQTGIVTLKDTDDNTVYTIDFKPKATHFPTVTTDWTDVGALPLADLQALASVIRADGKVNPDRLIFGEEALTNFLANASVKEHLDNRRMDLGAIAPSFGEDSGATFYGIVWLGSYRFEMWTYPETFEDPVTGLPTQYVDTNNVIMLSSRTRLDKASARVPLLVQPDPRVAGLLPDRMSNATEGFDVTPNIYVSQDGKQIMGDLESRTLLIPVQIDGFGTLDTIM